MIEDVVSAIGAWFCLACGSDDGAELAIWALRLRANERSLESIAQSGPRRALHSGKKILR